MRLTRLKKCEAWMIGLRRDGGMPDGYKAELSLQRELMLIGGESPIRSTANVIWDEGRLKCQVRNGNGDWCDLRNSDVEADLRRCYCKLLLLSVAGDFLAGLNLDLVATQQDDLPYVQIVLKKAQVDQPMKYSDFDYL
jgi:hypothetical protein